MIWKIVLCIFMVPVVVFVFGGLCLIYLKLTHPEIGATENPYLDLEKEGQ